MVEELVLCQYKIDRGYAAIIESSRRQDRVMLKKKKVDLIANKIRKRVNNKNIRVYNNPNNPNLNNNSKPRVYV